MRLQHRQAQKYKHIHNFSSIPCFQQDLAKLSFPSHQCFDTQDYADGIRRPKGRTSLKAERNFEKTIFLQARNAFWKWRMGWKVISSSSPLISLSWLLDTMTANHLLWRRHNAFGTGFACNWTSGLAWRILNGEVERKKECQEGAFLCHQFFRRFIPYTKSNAQIILLESRKRGKTKQQKQPKNKKPNKRIKAPPLPLQKKQKQPKSYKPGQL